MSVDRLPVSKLDAGHRRAAELVTRGQRLERELGAYFQAVADERRGLEDEGSLWLGPAYPELVLAAFRVWSQATPAEVDAELELARLGEVPLMNLDHERPAVTRLEKAVESELER